MRYNATQVYEITSLLKSFPSAMRDWFGSNQLIRRNKSVRELNEKYPGLPSSFIELYSPVQGEDESPRSFYIKKRQGAYFLDKYRKHLKMRQKRFDKYIYDICYSHDIECNSKLLNQFERDFTKFMNEVPPIPDNRSELDRLIDALY